MIPWIDLAGDAASDILLIADHASDIVPEGIDLGVHPALMREHVAVDIGVSAVAEALGLRSILGGVSRLVIDLNREENGAGLVPLVSDGHPIPGNRHASTTERLDRYWRPYHRYLSRTIESLHPKLLVSLHSFTPRLASKPGEQRPWEVGVLYNRDERAARVAIPLLERAGVVTGDNLPYSGKVLNATMNRHGEANGLPYLGLEVRQDLIADPAGAARWAGMLDPIIRATRDALA